MNKKQRATLIYVRATMSQVSPDSPNIQKSAMATALCCIITDKIGK